MTIEFMDLLSYEYTVNGQYISLDWSVSRVLGTGPLTIDRIGVNARAESLEDGLFTNASVFTDFLAEWAQTSLDTRESERAYMRRLQTGAIVGVAGEAQALCLARNEGVKEDSFDFWADADELRGWGCTIDEIERIPHFAKSILCDLRFVDSDEHSLEFNKFFRSLEKEG